MYSAYNMYYVEYVSVCKLVLHLGIALKYTSYVNIVVKGNLCSVVVANLLLHIM